MNSGGSGYNDLSNFSCTVQSFTSMEFCYEKLILGNAIEYPVVLNDKKKTKNLLRPLWV